MFLRNALGAALLAVPLTGVAGQSATEQHPSTASPADSSSGSGHRFAWVAGAGLTGAAVFTTFVRMSGRTAAADAERGLALPNSPTPNHYTDGSLPGSGVSPGQNAPPPTTDSGKGATIGGATQPGVSDLPGTYDQLPSDSATDGGDEWSPPPQDPPPQNHGPTPPPREFAVVVTTPEPGSIALLGTGLVALFPAVQLRRRA